MKHSFLFFVFPALAAAQNMDLTEQLGKTVLYGDVALAPDGQRVAWVQSTAATTSKQTYISKAAVGSAPTKIDIRNGSERMDAEPAWSPDSKSLAFLSTVEEKNEQRQLWIVNADGTGAKKLTELSGYAARPRWSRDGKQVAVLYIEGAGGGGPLMAHPPTTGVIDKAIHNQRIAALDVSTGQLRQVSPPDLHIYDFDWSPDDKTFVVTAAPGPGDNNW
jgi:Tol biopolymer transport system component